MKWDLTIYNLGIGGGSETKGCETYTHTPPTSTKNSGEFVYIDHHRIYALVSSEKY